MRYSFHPEAVNEFLQSIDYYEDQQRELGLEFAGEIYKTIQRVKAHPQTWTPLSKNIRRALVQRFPFGVLFNHDEKNDHLFIVAVMHLKREPTYWQDRI